MQATVKSYDSLTKKGVLISDDGSTEYPFDPEAIDQGMFRFLRPGQRVTFELDEIGQEKRAVNLRIGVS